MAAVGVDSTQGSMQVLIGKLFKKLRENDCFITEEDEADSKDAMKKRKVDGIKDGDSDATDEHPKPKRIVELGAVTAMETSSASKMGSGPSAMPDS